MKSNSHDFIPCHCEDCHGSEEAHCAECHHPKNAEGHRHPILLDITLLPKHIRTALEEIAVMYANAELWKKERDEFAEALACVKTPEVAE